MDELIHTLKQVVANQPGMTGREYKRMLINQGFPNITKTKVNSVLYGNPNIFDFTTNAGNVPSWFLITPTNLAATLTPPADKLIWDPSLGLFPWQERALNSWANNKFLGVIEAVTGAGKTHVALAAIDAHLKNEWKVVVLVPSIVLQEQWHRIIQQMIIAKLGNDYTLALWGGDNRPTNNWDILIAVANTAARYQMLNPGEKGVIIADECHRYGSPHWSKCLEPGFERRLGLTATYERADNGIDMYLDPFFRTVCHRFGYQDALSDNVIAHFKIAFVGVDFEEKESIAYKKYDETCGRLKNKLINTHNVDREPFGEFIKEVAALTSGGEGEAKRDARSYMIAFNRRRQVVAGAQKKTKCLAELTSVIRAAERTIIFSQTKEAAENAVNELTRLRLNAKVLDCNMTLKERKAVFAAFEQGDEEVVAAPMLLDEGVDVPSADLAIILAASRSRRQMIQRMGRVLRKKDDDRLARIVIIYVKDTAEDPANGAHETFIKEIRDVATEEKSFDAAADTKQLCDYLNRR